MKDRVTYLINLGIFMLVLYILLDAFLFLSIPPNSAGNKVKVVIPQGSSFTDIVHILTEKRLLRSAIRFQIMARLTGNTKTLKAGEYDLNTCMKPHMILSKLVQGDVAKYQVTIPEGYTIRQIAACLEQKGVIKDQGEFLKLAFSNEFAKGLGIEGESVEGYLFPDTYVFSSDLSPENLIKIMVKKFRKVYELDLSLRAVGLGLTDREAVILASIIEKETGLAEERPLISSVFHNRMKKGIPLCSDPTVIYGIKDFDGNIRKRDLITMTPYNTYLIKGLPAGPIANPGRSSIVAALYPAPVKYLYFVSRNNGSHYFSASLREHNAAVWRYQKSGKGTTQLK